MVFSKKKGVHLESIFTFPTFRPDLIITSKKHLQQIETVCAIFERAPQKKGGPRQLPHSPHPISTSGKQQRVISMAGFSRFTKAAKPLYSPIIAKAPSVQIPVQVQLHRFISMAIKTSWSLEKFPDP